MSDPHLSRTEQRQVQMLLLAVGELRGWDRVQAWGWLLVSPAARAEFRRCRRSDRILRRGLGTTAPRGFHPGLVAGSCVAALLLIALAVSLTVRQVALARQPQLRNAVYLPQADGQTMLPYRID